MWLWLAIIPTEETEAATSTSIYLWIAAGLVVVLGMARLPLMPDRLWRFICWSVAIVLGFYAASRIEVIPSGPIWSTWAFLLILVLALLFWVERLRGLEHRENETAKEKSLAVMPETPPPEARVSDSSQVAPAPVANQVVTSGSEFVFAEAPAELAEMTGASLKEMLAEKTDAQVSKIMEQHRGKPVSVFGRVLSVDLGSMPQVLLRTSTGLSTTFFDGTDYDAEPLLLALNKGDEVLVSGRIFRIKADGVSLEHCNRIEVRGRPS